jgi:hypothetical protein
MFITAEANTTIGAPAEHFAPRFASRDNRPHEGVEFGQRESVAGDVADLHGRFHVMHRPHLALWSGVATYSPTRAGALRAHGCSTSGSMAGGRRTSARTVNWSISSGNSRKCRRVRRWRRKHEYLSDCEQAKRETPMEFSV